MKKKRNERKHFTSTLCNTLESTHSTLASHTYNRLCYEFISADEEREKKRNDKVEATQKLA